MPLDPQAIAVLKQMANAPPVNTLTPEQARINFEARPREAGPEVAKVEDCSVPGTGGGIPVRIYTPAGTGPFPAVLWFHGGGWVVGSIDGQDAACRHLANASECVVVSVEYRLAPEAKFPEPLEDCYVATAWVAANASSFNADGGRVAVGGASAGGNLAAAVALLARDRGRPTLSHQLLAYPVTDRSFDTGSYRQFGDGYGLTRAAMEWYWQQYLADEADAGNPLAAPLQAADLSGLPPALVMTAEFDPLRDEGEAYAGRLNAAGVAARCIRYDGLIHGFFGRLSEFDKAKDAVADAAAALKAAFAR